MQACLNGFGTQIKQQLIARLSHGGPGLSNAMFSLGLADIKQTLEETAEAALAYKRDSKVKTFTENLETW